MGRSRPCDQLENDFDFSGRNFQYLVKSQRDHRIPREFLPINNVALPWKLSGYLGATIPYSRSTHLNSDTRQKTRPRIVDCRHATI